MVCIYCSGETAVINSRKQKRLNQIWRRRQCLNCQAVFTTHEQIDLAAAWQVKFANDLQPFLRDKLFLSLHDSLRHRKTAVRDATALTDTVISRLTAHAKQAMIEKTDIVTSSREVLQRFDRVAAISYQAFHPADKPA